MTGLHNLKRPVPLALKQISPFSCAACPVVQFLPTTRSSLFAATSLLFSVEASNVEPLVRAVSYSTLVCNFGRVLSERVSMGSARRRMPSRNGQIGFESFRNSNVFFRGKSNVIPFAFGMDNLIYSMSDNDGPIELPPRDSDIDPFAIPEATPIQIVASVLLTGAIAVLLTRSLRRRAARAKEMKFRSSGVSTSKSIKEEARKTVVANLLKAPEVRTPPPSAIQTAAGAVVAGAIAFVLYKFSTLVDAGFAQKAVSQNYSVRNLTITVRTIISGLCYLATFVFAANSIGLSLYAVQLLFGSGDEPPPSASIEEKEITPVAESDDLNKKQ